MSEIPFSVTYCFADNAARILAEQRPKPKDAELGLIPSRRILRQEAVMALRWLWKHGGRDAQLSVCARVGIWMGRPAEERNKAYERVKARRVA